MNTDQDRLSHQRLQDLMALYFAQRISMAEQDELWGYINDPFYQQQVKDLIPDSTEQDLSEGRLDEQRADAILGLIFAKADQEDKKIRVIEKPIWKRLSVVAAVVAILCIGGWFYYSGLNAPESGVDTDLVHHDIPAGTEGATLRLADGRTIVLGDAVKGEIASEAGIMVEKGVDGELTYRVGDSEADGQHPHVLATDRGQTYRVLLPDGSAVWLNAMSELTYRPALVEAGKRVVHLKGEAYFEIAKDSKHPFVVKSRNQEVRVLGTHFNVNAYNDEPFVATTLLEGAVRLYAGGVERLLSPGQQAVNRDGELRIRTVSLDNVTDWKDGDFAFQQVDFRTALRKIERWYDVEMVYDESLPKDLAAGGWISRKKSLSSVLRFIESTKIVRFKVEGRKVYVTRY
ncbi:MAG: FecR domain-containing protein [Sphingobacterium sp.]|jgi:hypothetical protein|nr:FecR domain-containing protein [Sphingobacterium sp.]